MPTFDTRAVRQALKALGSEPAPVPVDDERRVVLAGGGNEIAMSLYRAMGRGTTNLSEPQIRQRQAEMLEQFQREAEAVLRLLTAFRTVTSLDDYRAEARGLPEPETVVVQTTGVGTLHHAAVGAEAVPVRPGATYRLRPSEADMGAEEGAAGRWEGSSASRVVDKRVQRLRQRVAPDMETCDDCKGTVAWIPDRQQFVHTDSDLVAYSKDGHIIHAERLQQITDSERLRELTEKTPALTREEAERQFPEAALQLQYRGPEFMWSEETDPPVQEGPAMDTEEEAKAIVQRAMEAARRDIDAHRARAADNDRDSGIEPGIVDTSEFPSLGPKPYAEKSAMGRMRDRLERWRRYLDGYTAREMDELEAHQQRRR